MDLIIKNKHQLIELNKKIKKHRLIQKEIFDNY